MVWDQDVAGSNPVVPTILPGVQQFPIRASLPCYSAETVDGQRGGGVFEKSIRALRKLNTVGYVTTLPLNLVHTPAGPQLPPAQAEVEADVRLELRSRLGIEFTRLIAITNQPIARFAEDLRALGQWDSYLELLANSFKTGNRFGIGVPKYDQRRLAGRSV